MKYIKRKTDFFYDDQGNLIQEISYHSSYSSVKFITFTVYDYDENNRLIHKHVEDDYNNVYEHITYTYDESGNIISSVLNDSLMTITNYEYDEYGRVIRESDCIDTYHYHYDEYDNISCIINTTTNDVIHYSNEYENNRLVRAISEEDITEYEYNEKGYLINKTVKSMASDGDILYTIIFRYTYDENSRIATEIYEIDE